MSSKLGISSLCLAFIALGYPALRGIIGLGYSGKVSVIPQSLIELLGVEHFMIGINSIPFGFVHRSLLFALELPIFILHLGISGNFFVIHFMAPEKS
jgi:hypothetical protein